MGVQVYWVPSVLGFIFNNGQPSVLGFIFYNGQPRIRIGVLGFIFYNGRPKNSNMGVQVYWVPSVLGFILPRIPTWESRCTGFYFLLRTTKNSNMRVQVYWVLFFITDNQEFGIPGVLCFIFYNQ
jgi:hypothetical protein